MSAAIPEHDFRLLDSQSQKAGWIDISNLAVRIFFCASGGSLTQSFSVVTRSARFCFASANSRFRSSLLYWW
jgi:hypothetical protein